MRQASHVLRCTHRGPGLVEITGAVSSWVEAQRMTTGLLTLFCRHTSASLLIQRIAAPAVRADLGELLHRPGRPEDPARYSHDDEGDDDMPAHIRAALTGVSLSIPGCTPGPWRWAPGRASSSSSTAARPPGGRSPCT